MIFGQVLAQSSSSESTSFSVPLLVAAAAGVTWVLLPMVLVAWRRPGSIEPGPPSQEPPPAAVQLWGPPLRLRRCDWPPGWGKHPAFAPFLAVLWGAVSVGALYGLVRLARSAADPITSADPTFTGEQLDWIGRGALLLLGYVREMRAAGPT